MRKRFVSSLAVMLVLGLSLILPAFAQADTDTILPQSGISKTYSLSQGDTISWDWEVVGDGELDFWIQDSEGNKYEFVDESTRSNGTFEVTEDGEWMVYLWNDNTNPPSIVVEYDISVTWSMGLPPWGWMIICIMLLIGGIALVAGAVREKMPKPRPPWQSRYPSGPPQYQPAQPPQQPPQQPPSR